MMEWVKHSSYGVPIGLPAGDTDSDGDCDQTDINTIDNWVSGYDVRYDLDLDGDVDAADSSRASTTFQGTTLGWDVLSSSSVSNRKGYAGYEYDEAVSKYHVRNRVFDPALGRWTRRDPLGYVDGLSLYEYVGSRVIRATDSNGLITFERGPICLCVFKFHTGKVKIECDDCKIPMWIIPENKNDPAFTDVCCGKWYKADAIIINGKIYKIHGSTCVTIKCVGNTVRGSACCNTVVEIFELFGEADCLPNLVPPGTFGNEPPSGSGKGNPPVEDCNIHEK